MCVIVCMPACLPNHAGLLGMTTCSSDQTLELQKLGVYQLSRKNAAAVLKLRVDYKTATKPGGDSDGGDDDDDDDDDGLL